MCYCGSDLEFSKCCKLYINGEVIGRNAVEVMKSRFSAFASKNIDYILDTHHPETRNEVSKEEVELWSKKSDFLSLIILDTVAGQKDDQKGIVEFVAEYKTEGYIRKHRERSIFKKLDGKWYYHSQIDPSPEVLAKKIGRNELCICGSGKKYKKCCGK